MGYKAGKKKGRTGVLDFGSRGNAMQARREGRVGETRLTQFACFHSQRGALHYVASDRRGEGQMTNPVSCGALIVATLYGTSATTALAQDARKVTQAASAGSLEEMRANIRPSTFDQVTPLENSKNAGARD